MAEVSKNFPEWEFKYNFNKISVFLCANAKKKKNYTQIYFIFIKNLKPWMDKFI